jgi:hypothetical protein
MKEDRLEERVELEERARWELEHPEQLEPRQAVEHAYQVLRLWYHPAFSDYVCGAVLRPRGRNANTSTLLIRRVVWKRTTDMQRFADPLEWLKQGYRVPPTITVDDAPLPADQFAALLAEVALAPVPLVGIAVPLGLDGETCGFEQMESPFLHVRLQWWCDGPEEWREFTRCIARMRAAFEQRFAGDAHEIG